MKKQHIQVSSFCHDHTQVIQSAWSYTTAILEPRSNLIIATLKFNISAPSGHRGGLNFSLMMLLRLSPIHFEMIEKMIFFYLKNLLMNSVAYLNYCDFFERYLRIFMRV